MLIEGRVGFVSLLTFGIKCVSVIALSSTQYPLVPILFGLSKKLYTFLLHLIENVLLIQNLKFHNGFYNTDYYVHINKIIHLFLQSGFNEQIINAYRYFSLEEPL